MTKRMHLIVNRMGVSLLGSIVVRLSDHPGPKSLPERWRRHTWPCGAMGVTCAGVNAGNMWSDSTGEDGGGFVPVMAIHDIN